MISFSRLAFQDSTQLVLCYLYLYQATQTMCADIPCVNLALSLTSFLLLLFGLVFLTFGGIDLFLRIHKIMRVRNKFCFILHACAHSRFCTHASHACTGPNYAASADFQKRSLRQSFCGFNLRQNSSEPCVGFNRIFVNCNLHRGLARFASV